MMKHKSNKKFFLIFAVIILLIVIAAGALIYHNSLQGERPFEDLTAEDVKSISLYNIHHSAVANGDYEKIVYTFNAEETEKIVKMLNGIAIGEEDNEDYFGGFYREFRLEKTDGTIIEFGVGAGFFYNDQRYEVPDNNISLIKLQNLRDEYYDKYVVPANS